MRIILKFEGAESMEECYYKAAEIAAILRIDVEFEYNGMKGIARKYITNNYELKNPEV
jgi:hypothetical protein